MGDAESVESTDEETVELTPVEEAEKLAHAIGAAASNGRAAARAEQWADVAHLAGAAEEAAVALRALAEEQ